jgi:rhamnogalacturonan endolyase
MLRKFVLIALALRPACGAELFSDDFARFPVGRLTLPLGFTNPAIQEYHYLPHRGVPLGPWESAICHVDAWLVGEEDGKSYLEQSLGPDTRQFTNPIFITGDSEWSDYTVQARVQPLSTADFAGVIFRYHTNRHYYMFSLTGGNRARLTLHLPIEQKLREPNRRELASAAFPYEAARYYTLKVENEGPRIKAYIDGKLILQVEDRELLKGRAGLTSIIPARFQDFRVDASDAARDAIRKRIAGRDAELEKLRAGNPQPKLWKKFSVGNFGAGRNLRMGDLDGDGKIDFLIAQNMMRYPYDAAQLTCLTAVNLEGKVLWQIGKPDPRNALLTYDLPFQIHDIDGDGRNEVVLIKDFKLQVLDGRTGKLLRSVPVPMQPPTKGQVYDRINGDSITFVNLSGDKRRHEILIKDRYSNFWVYNNKLEHRWHGDGQTGHYPYPFDVNGDGRDEIAIGYALWDHTGKQLWSHDKDLHDHADGIMMGNLSPDPSAPPRAYAGGSDEGFIMFDVRGGDILKHVRMGHGQSPTVGKYRMDVPGLQFVTVNFWRNPGIVTVFDWDGNILAQDEPIHSGSVMLPVNWRGDGQEFILLSGNAREGGMIDGHIRRVVMFPDDGHPDLTAYVADLTGDARDEIVLLDTKEIWIYTQDRPFTGKRIYAPLRNPDYNESNYRVGVSLPQWRDVK